MNGEFLERIEADPLAAVVEYYAERLHENPRALRFLEQRRLAADAHLRVGFADRTLGTLLPTSYIKKGRQLRSLLQTTGIVKDNGRERFRGLVTVPLLNTSGSVTGIYGLRIDPNQGEKETTLGTGLFNAAALQSAKEIILCQNIVDAWTFCGAGCNSAVAVTGIELTGAMFESASRILLAGDFDHDLFAGKELLQIVFPEGVSPAQYALQNRAVDDCLGRRIRAAEWISGARAERSEAITSVERSETIVTHDNTITAAQPQANQAPAASVKHSESSAEDLPVERNEYETLITIENRRWRIRGLDRNTTSGVMRVNVAVFNDAFDRFHVDSLDLYQSRARRSFLSDAAEETGLGEYDLRSDLARVLMKLEQLQHEQRSSEQAKDDTVTLTDAERAEAMQLLTDKHLLDRILDDFEACGIVGERIGKLTGYLVATSRLLPKPLGVVIQSSSAAGKTSLVSAVLSLMPPQCQLTCSAMTSQSLYYAANVDLRHKILSIAEEEGARNASYALKLLQSEGKLSIVTTAKESGTGRTILDRYDVEGPVATFMTTTASDVDPELMNRCFVVAVDEDAQQTAAIQARQRLGHTIDDQLAAEEAQHRRSVHRNAQRLLEPVKVDNPYVDQLQFPCRCVRDRRDNQAYLTLIDSIALLHQHQRERKSKRAGGKTIQYIEVTRGDIALANMILSVLMGSSIDDLPTQTRRLLMQIFQYVEALADKHDLAIGDVRFTRRELRESLCWGQTQLKLHLDRLAQYEYVHVHGGPGRTLRYELRFDGRGREGQRALYGLTDPATLVEPVARMTSPSSGDSGVSSGQNHR